jgi:NADPH:quinone reductase-like Zn-dependent oxidoreductase
MPSNTAAWQTARGKPIEIQPAPYPSPKTHELVLQNRAVAINPVDHMIQEMGRIIFSWLRLPAILGSDVAGTVISVGSAP